MHSVTAPHSPASCSGRVHHAVVPLASMTVALVCETQHWELKTMKASSNACHGLSPLSGAACCKRILQGLTEVEATCRWVPSQCSLPIDFV